MKQFLCMLTFSLLGLTAFSQLKVADIISDSLALKFVREVNYSKTQAPQWNHFYLTQGTEWNAYYNLTRKQQANVLATSHYLNWAKTDLNNDGKEDLIVSGYIARRPGDWSTATFKVLLFLSQKGNLYTEQDLLDDQSAKYPAYYNLTPINGKEYLTLYRWRVDINDKNKSLPIRIDTLNYNNPIDVFVNYCKKLQQTDILKIQYKALDDYNGSYHEAVLEDNDKKKVDLSIYTKQPTDNKPQLLKAKLSKDLWIQLDTLCRSLPKTGIQLNHQEQFKKEALPTELTIYYNDSTKVKFIDYGEHTSFTLSAINQAFESIIQNTLDLMAQRQQYIDQMMQNNW